MKQQSQLQPQEEAGRRVYVKPAMFQQGDFAKVTAR
ncbi:keywimysin-related RiPP [Streptomyces sp. BH097]